MLEIIKEMISKHVLDDIYLTGFIDKSTDGMYEFHILNRFLFLDLKGRMLKIEAIEQYSKLRLSESSHHNSEMDLDDMPPTKARVGQIIFNNPLTTHTIVSVDIFGIEIHLDEIICDALKFKLNHGQIIFIDPSYLGLNIGGPEVERQWVQNGVEGSIPLLTRIEADLTVN